MKKIFINMSLISFLLLASSCTKNGKILLKPGTEVLPPITQTGAGTFGCLINGKVWLPGGPGTTLDAQYSRGSLSLYALKDSGPENSKGINQIFQSLSMSYEPIYKLGTYYFKYFPPLQGLGAGFMDYASNCNYQANDQDSLQTYITVTKLDSIHRIVSGTFNFLFIPSGPGCDTLKITQGRFDMKYEF